jgi:hypothetical protein
MSTPLRYKRSSLIAPIQTKDIAITAPSISSPSADIDPIYHYAHFQLSDFDIQYPIGGDAATLTIQFSRTADFNTVLRTYTAPYDDGLWVPPEELPYGDVYVRCKYDSTKGLSSPWSVPTLYNVFTPLTLSGHLLLDGSWQLNGGPYPGTKDPAVVGLCLVRSDVSGGEWAYVDEFGNPAPVPNFDHHPVFRDIIDVMIDGQYMVEFPAFYVKVVVFTSGFYAGKTAWFATDQPKPGYELHMAFWWDGIARDKFWLGKYQGSLDDDGRLCSVPGVLPAVSITIDEFDTAACLRNESCPDGGFVQQNFWMWSALQWLVLLRYATMDIQVAVGMGRVNATEAAAVDAPDVAEATVFGVVGAWGNIWQWLVGIRISSGAVSAFDGAQQFAEIPTYTPPVLNTWIYPNSFDSSTTSTIHGFFPVAYQLEPSGTVCGDLFYYSSDELNYFSVGGHYGPSDPMNPGLWMLSGSSLISTQDNTIGSRLAKVSI